MSDFHDPQTAAEIKALYESNADTNAYTDAEKSKLAGIEAGATADQSGAEIKTLLNGLLTETELSAATREYICKAWVNFNGSGTVAINDSVNVTSITDNGVGDYTVNFTTAFASALYAFAGNAERSGFPQPCIVGYKSGGTRTSSACQVRVNDDGATAHDSPNINIIFFGP